MLITTQDQFADYTIIESLGIAKGNTIRARHVGNDFMAALKNLVGGEISQYTKMLSDSREEAINRMIEDAKSMGADGIVCMRLTTSTVMQGSAELLAYGTAVKLQKK